MANSLRNFANLAALLFFLFLILSTQEMQVVEGKGKLCQRRSKTWSGICWSSKNCDRQCRKWEHAVHGACHHPYFVTRACFCYFNC